MAGKSMANQHAPHGRGRGRSRPFDRRSGLQRGGGPAALHARIAEVARRLKETRGLAAEVIYVDDGSRDATLAVARGLPPTRSTFR